MTDNFLHYLQLQLSFHPLICLLNDARVLMVLNLSGRLFKFVDSISFSFLSISIKAILEFGPSCINPVEVDE